MVTTLLKSESAVLAVCCEQNLPLAGASLNAEYFYQSLPLCVIDAVYSIGVRYEGVQEVVWRYCEYFGLQRFRKPRDCMPTTTEQQPLSALIEKMSSLGADKFAREIFQNRQRTSTRSGILKAEAVLRFASVLRDQGMNFLQDAPHGVSNVDLEAALRQIPGQGSGISISYFFMLAGSEDLIKPDRWIMSFLQRCLDRFPSLDEARVLLSEACKMLQPTHPHLTPRLLDNIIWRHQRGRD